MNSDMPGGEVGSEEESREGDQREELASRPVNRLTSHCSNDEQERQCEREPPDSGCNWPDSRQPHQPGPEGERAAPDHDGGESEAMVGLVHGEGRYGIPRLPEKPEPSPFR